MKKSIAIIIIGRNEGDRLNKAFDSLPVGEAILPLYVDSNSSDDSVARAKAAGLAVIPLSTDQPLSAARARNAGVAHLAKQGENFEYIQFLDGDSSLAGDWLRAAKAHLDSNPAIAAVCGHLIEATAASSLYGQLAQMEWAGPAGDIDSCGGIFMIRRTAFDRLGGFDESLSAGEEPDLCLRLHIDGWMIQRLDHTMAIHDMGPMSFGLWWRRMARGGRAIAAAVHKHGFRTDYYAGRAFLRAGFWGGLLPTCLILAILWPAALWGLLLYPVQYGRMAMRSYGGHISASTAAVFLILAKFAECQGLLGSLFSPNSTHQHSQQKDML